MLPPTLYFVRFFDKLRMTVLINTEPLSVIMHAPFNHAENTYCHSEHTRFPVTLNEVEGSHRASGNNRGASPTLYFVRFFDKLRMTRRNEILL